MQLHRHAEELAGAGAGVAVIGNGTPNFIEGFRDKTGYAGAIYTDPKRAVYRALNLRRSLRSTFDPRGMSRAISALRDGFRQTKTQGDPFQQGGVFVIDPSGAVHYQYKSRFAGDHPPIEDLLQSVRGMRPEP